MSWHYRVVKTDVSYAIHTVYLDYNGDIVNISEKPSSLIGDNLDDLKWNLESIHLALDKPVIDYNTGEEIEND